MDELKLECQDSRNPRPVCNEAMYREAAGIIVAGMTKMGIIAPNDVAGSVDDLVEVTIQDSDRDGYQIARALEEQKLWTCDMAMAEEFDRFSTILSDIHAAAEKQWGESNPREPPFPAGAEVTWRGKPASVIGIYERRPQCFMLRQGEMNNGSFSVVPYEEVSDAPEHRDDSDNG